MESILAWKSARMESLVESSREGRDGGSEVEWWFDMLLVLVPSGDWLAVLSLAVRCKNLGW